VAISETFGRFSSESRLFEDSFDGSGGHPDGGSDADCGDGSGDGENVMKRRSQW